MDKLNVLWVGEAPYLNTGYGVMTREFLSRWHSTGKYNINELSIWGDEREATQRGVPWRVYGNLPKNEEEAKVYGSDQMNPLGKWKFDQVALHCRADVVIDARDIFMCPFEFDSAYRRFYTLIHQPTVDASPQNDDWMQWFQQADAIIPYTNFGFEEIKSLDNGTIRLLPPIPPCVDFEIFKPIPNKKELRKFYNLDPDMLIIGMFARNQKRKLFSDLFESFATLIKKAPKNISDKLYLYLHTSFPDQLSWNLPTLLNEFGLHNRVMFTYTCGNQDCKMHRPMLFQDARAVCPRCNTGSLVFPSTRAGVESIHLSQLYNLIDFYVQAIAAGGFEIPCAEAAACGVPLLVTDYSSTEDFKTSLKAYPLKIKEYSREIETGRYFSIPDKDDLVDKCIKFLSLPSKLRQDRGMECANAARQSYSWDKSAAAWMQIIDQCPKRNWNAPPNIMQPNQQIPQGLNNNDFMAWAIINILGEPHRLNTYLHMNLLRKLNNVLSEHGQIDRNWICNTLYNRRQYINQRENERVNSFRGN
jgi:glycosyltransferase involved in cell wall biosynthesis